MIPRITHYQPRHDLENRADRVALDVLADLAARSARARIRDQIQLLRRVDAARQHHEFETGD